MLRIFLLRVIPNLKYRINTHRHLRFLPQEREVFREENAKAFQNNKKAPVSLTLPGPLYLISDFIV